MADTEETPTPAPSLTTPPIPVKTPQELAAEAEAERKQRQMIIIGSIGAVVLLVAILAIGIWLIQPGTPTDKIRDVFIIFMALESLIIGGALVVLIVQIAMLMNLLNNEIKPMLEATNETISTLRGTTQFLSENLVEPVIKLNSYVAGLQKMLDIFNLKK
ncbi:MAG TPA: hypothetical protein VHK86_04545 [Nitrososphaera sp.]|nr:hypothetical protein [Nitrososphaera sp.]